MNRHISRSIRTGYVMYRPASVRFSSVPDLTKKDGTVSFVDMAYGNPLQLPRLPIPTLEGTMAKYLEVRIEYVVLGTVVPNILLYTGRALETLTATSTY